MDFTDALVPIQKNRYESLGLVAKTPTKLFLALGGVFILGNTPAVWAAFGYAAIDIVILMLDETDVDGHQLHGHFPTK